MWFFYHVDGNALYSYVRQYSKWVNSKGLVNFLKYILLPSIIKGSRDSWVGEAPGTKSGDLSSIPKLHKVDRENQLPVTGWFSDFHICAIVCTYHTRTHTHTINAYSQ